MLVVSQSPNGALSAKRLPSSPFLSKSISCNFSQSRSNFENRRKNSPRNPLLSLSNPEAGPTTSRPPPPAPADEAVSVADEGVPLEGVIRIERPGNGDFSAKLQSWAQVGLLTGGDVLCLLVFSAIGRFSHGLSVLDWETLKTADPFVAGWILSAYFFGAYGDDGKGKNGTSKAIFAAVKSWAVGVPLGIGIRAVTIGHVPATPFILVTMGSTGVLFLAWRFLALKILSADQSKQNDDFRRGSPFELFELLTSLVRRW